MTTHPWLTALGLAVASRTVALAVGAAAVATIGFPLGEDIPAEASPGIVVNLPARWDTGWYMGIAGGGYRWDGAAGRFENIAFFPAYPLLVRVTARGLGFTTANQWRWLAVGLSVTLFALALSSLWQLARLHMDAGRATWCMAICAASPFAIFFGLPYTESLFLLGLVGLTLCFERRQYLPAMLFGIVAGLTRPVAFIATCALLVAVGVDVVRQRPLRRATAAAWIPALGAAVSPLFGMGIYSAFIYGLTGHPFTWATVQEGWGRPTQNPLMALAAPLVALVADPFAAVAASPHDVLNAGAGLVALGLTWPIARRFGPGYGVLVFVGTVVPLTAGGVASLGRYTAVLFPLYLWAAAALPRRALTVTIVGMACVQAAVAAMFFTWRPMY